MESIPYWEDKELEEPDETSTENSAGADEKPEEAPELATSEEVGVLLEEVRGIRTDISALNDLFVRRLLEDRQKSELIKTLKEESSFAIIEPFIHDLILLLDRVERVDSDFADSVAEELLEILLRRNIERIHVTPRFNPNLQKIVRTVERDDIEENAVVAIVRNGYTFGGKVIRPAEVVYAKAVAPIEAVPDEAEGESDGQ